MTSSSAVNMEEKEALKRQIELLQSKSAFVNVDSCKNSERVNEEKTPALFPVIATLRVLL